jgi:hypothetical protein
MAKKRYFFQTEETVTTTRKGYIEIDEEFVQVYDCITRVSPFIKMGASYQLLLWLGTTMNPMNGITIAKKTFNDFNKHLKTDCENCEISARTFTRAVEELRKAGILTKAARSLYYINPHFFWKGTKNARINFLTEETKDGGIVSYNPQIEDPKRLNHQEQ